jgi:hypothetical protein
MESTNEKIELNLLVKIFEPKAALHKNDKCLYNFESKIYKRRVAIGTSLKNSDAKNASGENKNQYRVLSQFCFNLKLL